MGLQALVEEKLKKFIISRQQRHEF